MPAVLRIYLQNQQVAQLMCWQHAWELVDVGTVKTNGDHVCYDKKGSIVPTPVFVDND